MTTKTIKTVLFAGIFAVMLIPLMGQQEAEAMGVPVFTGVDQGLIVDWWGQVPHETSNWVYSNSVDYCGEHFISSGFYDTYTNKRGASHHVPDRINAICNFDADLSGYFNLTLQKVEYSFYGDGNTSVVRLDMGAADMNYIYLRDAFSNSGFEYVNVKLTYQHTS